MRTTDKKSEEYSTSLCNQSGTYSKGAIETAFVSGFNSAMEEIGESAGYVIAERRRQINDKKLDAAHDDKWVDGELAQAASCYALPPFIVERNGLNSCCMTKRFPTLWPPTWKDRWWKPAKNDSIDERLQELSKSGALILAEMDRLQRAKRKTYDGRNPGRTLFISEEEYYAIKNSISSIHQVIGAFNHEGIAKARRLEFAKKLENLIERYEGGAKQ